MIMSCGLPSGREDVSVDSLVAEWAAIPCDEDDKAWIQHVTRRNFYPKAGTRWFEDLIASPDRLKLVLSRSVTDGTHFDPTFIFDRLDEHFDWVFHQDAIRPIVETLWRWNVNRSTSRLRLLMRLMHSYDIHDARRTRFEGESVHSQCVKCGEWVEFGTNLRSRLAFPGIPLGRESRLLNDTDPERFLPCLSAPNPDLRRRSQNAFFFQGRLRAECWFPWWSLGRVLVACLDERTKKRGAYTLERKIHSAELNHIFGLFRSAVTRTRRRRVAGLQLRRLVVRERRRRAFWCHPMLLPWFYDPEHHSYDYIFSW